MSKRARPLSTIEWSLLDQPDGNHSPNKRGRFSNHNSQDDQDMEAEEETAQIDQGGNLGQQRHGMAILNSMAIDRSSIIIDTRKAGNRQSASNNNGGAPQTEVTNVPLNLYYNTLYNKTMQDCFPSNGCYASDECTHSHSDSDEDDEENDVFGSLGRSTSSGMSISGESPHRHTADRRKKKKRPRRRDHRILPYNTNERAECFLCMWGNKYHDGIKAKHVNGLHNIILKQYPKCNNIDLAKQCELYFMKWIYRPGTGMGRLTKEIALEHIEGLHTLNATIFIGESMRKCVKIMYGLEHHIFKSNDKFDKEASREWREYLKQIQSLYKMNPDEMLFNYGQTRKDTADMGQPFNLMVQRKQQVEKNRRAKRTEQIVNSNESFNRGFEA